MVLDQIFFRFWLKHLSGNLRRDEKLMGSIFTTWEIFSKQLNIHIWSSKIRWAKNKYLGFMNKWWELKPRKYWRLFRWAIQKTSVSDMRKSLGNNKHLEGKITQYLMLSQKKARISYWMTTFQSMFCMKLYHFIAFHFKFIFTLQIIQHTDPYTQTQIS